MASAEGAEELRHPSRGKGEGGRGKYALFAKTSDS